MPEDFQFCVRCGYDFKTGKTRTGGKIGTYSSGWTPARIAKTVITGVLIIVGFYGIWYTYKGLTKEDKPEEPVKKASTTDSPRRLRIRHQIVRRRKNQLLYLSQRRSKTAP